MYNLVQRTLGQVSNYTNMGSKKIEPDTFVDLGSPLPGPLLMRLIVRLTCWSLERVLPVLVLQNDSIS